jgi:hypothetical protein
VALAEDVPAGAVLRALNSHPLSCSEIAIPACAGFTAPDMDLLSFKSAKLSGRQVAGSIAAQDSLLLLPLSLIDGSSPGQVSKQQEDSQAASHCCRQSPNFHLFVSLFKVQSRRCLKLGNNQEVAVIRKDCCGFMA